MYDHPNLYDIAFSYRDVASECDFLLELSRLHGGREADSFLELGCGPGAHTLEMAARGHRALGLDLAPEMVEYARTYAVEAQSVRFQQADMRYFQLSESFSMAATMMDSTSHLLSNADMVDHLEHVATHLQSGGLHVLEMAHPSNHFGLRSTTTPEWTTEREGLEVTLKWGHEGDSFDPIAEVHSVSVELTARRDGHPSYEVVETVLQRRYTHQTLRALVELATGIEAIAWYGAFDTNVPLSNDKTAWRMIAVLKKS